MELESVLPKKCPTCGESLLDVPQYINDKPIYLGGKNDPVWICSLSCSQKKCSSHIICAFQCRREIEGGLYSNHDPRDTEKHGFGSSLEFPGEAPRKSEIKFKLLWVFPNIRWTFEHPELIDESIAAFFRDAYDCYSVGKMLGAAAYARTCLYAILDKYQIPDKDEKGAYLAATDRLDLLKEHFQSLDKHINYLKTVVWIGEDYLHRKHAWNADEIQKVLQNLVMILARLTEEKRLEKELGQFANARGKK